MRDGSAPLVNSGQADGLIRGIVVGPASESAAFRKPGRMASRWLLISSRVSFFSLGPQEMPSEAFLLQSEGAGLSLENSQAARGPVA